MVGLTNWKKSMLNIFNFTLSELFCYQSLRKSTPGTENMKDKNSFLFGVLGSKQLLNPGGGPSLVSFIKNSFLALVQLSFSYKRGERGTQWSYKRGSVTWFVSPRAQINTAGSLWTCKGIIFEYTASDSWRYSNRMFAVSDPVFICYYCHDITVKHSLKSKYNQTFAANPIAEIWIQRKM